MNGTTLRSSGRSYLFPIPLSRSGVIELHFEGERPQFPWVREPEIDPEIFHFIGTDEKSRTRKPKLRLTYGKDEAQKIVASRREEIAEAPQERRSAMEFFLEVDVQTLWNFMELWTPAEGEAAPRDRAQSRVPRWKFVRKEAIDDLTSNLLRMSSRRRTAPKQKDPRILRKEVVATWRAAPDQIQNHEEFEHAVLCFAAIHEHAASIAKLRSRDDLKQAMEWFATGALLNEQPAVTANRDDGKHYIGGGPDSAFIFTWAEFAEDARRICTVRNFRERAKWWRRFRDAILGSLHGYICHFRPEGSEERPVKFEEYSATPRVTPIQREFYVPYFASGSKRPGWRAKSWQKMLNQAFGPLRPRR